MQKSLVWCQTSFTSFDMISCFDSSVFWNFFLSCSLGLRMNSVKIESSWFETTMPHARWTYIALSSLSLFRFFPSVRLSYFFTFTILDWFSHYLHLYLHFFPSSVRIISRFGVRANFLLLNYICFRCIWCLCSGFLCVDFLSGPNWRVGRSLCAVCDYYYRYTFCACACALVCVALLCCLVKLYVFISILRASFWHWNGSLLPSISYYQQLMQMLWSFIHCGLW